jgi:hypothetical protein
VRNLYKKNDIPEKDIIDIDIFDEEDLEIEIFTEQNKELIWYFEELDVITDHFEQNISDEQKERLKKVAEILRPCFEAFLEHENPKLRKYCITANEMLDQLFNEKSQN